MPIRVQILSVFHRSPPVDQQNSASDDKTDHPAVGTNRVIKMKPGSKRLRRMPGSKIILPSSDAEDYYCRAILCSTISRIVNPEGTCDCV